MDTLVIGCGVSGLTTALSLLRDGHRVQIWARALPPNTTSNRAAAVWFPYKAYPEEKVTAWGKVAFATFKRMQAIEGVGIHMARCLECRPVLSPDPWWVDAVDDFRHAEADELPAGYPDGYFFESPVIDTSIYLAYLVRTFQQEGGRIVQRSLTSLADAFEQSKVVVNCAGLGARELVGDRDIHAARGQAIRVRQRGFGRVLLDEEGPNRLAYIVPRATDIILGGTFEEGNESTEVDAEETRAILRRCARLAPEFANVGPDDILDIYCGLRPVRSTVRVEAERVAPERLLLHNYGHGGAGVTLSWGCASEVVALYQKIFQ